MFLDINLIDIGERLREDLGEDFPDLIDSIKRVGQIQSIVVKKNGDGSYKLVAGERRFRAIVKIYGQDEIVKGLPPGTIKAEIEDALTEEIALIMEFEENVRRKEFTFQEKAKYVKKLHDHFTRLADGKWTAEMTALSLKLSPSSISHYLDLDRTIEAHPEVGKAKTMRGAIKRSKKIKQQKVREELAKSNEEGTQRAAETLYNKDGLEWLKSLASDSVDLINLDPPWGENVSYKTWKAWDGGFDDSTEYASELIPSLLEQSFRVLRPDRFCIFWYRTWAYADMLGLAQQVGFSLKHAKTPCVWYKPDKVSDQMAYPEKQLITSYENFLIIRKGDPVFYEKEVQNVFVEPRVPANHLIHPTEKPISLMQRLVKLCSVPGEIVVDPTAGSGSTLAAAWLVHRKPMGCELDDKLYRAAFTRLVEVMK